MLWRVGMLLLAVLSSIVLAACGGGGGDRIDSATATSADSAVAEADGRASALAAGDGWTLCAEEGQTCNVSGTQTVRYGVDGAYVTREVTGSVSCSNAVFGDPAFGRRKSCEVQGAAAPAAGAWNRCASEGQTCNVSGTQTVRYGVDGSYVTRQVTGSVLCSNAVFGDPAFGRAKSCEVQGATAPAAGSWTYCAGEGQVCYVAYTRHVRYGVDTSYVSRDVTGSVSCSNAAFGDPAPGRTKHCDVSDSTAPASPPSPAPAPPPSANVSGPGPLSVSSPTAVIGNGSASSCNESSLRSAVANGGVITFNCGAGTATIGLTQPLVAPTDRDTTIDGGDRIVLDGQGVTQILRAWQNNFRANDRTLAVQRLTMTRGRDGGSGYVPRNGSSSCSWGFKEGGGGAIYTRDLNVRVWGVTFDGNRGPEVGPDVAGGAIYVTGAKTLMVNNSTFRNNSASNGGAIGVLHVASEIHNTTFTGNRASGELANFGGAAGCPVFNHDQQGGAGGLGGAFYSDGFNTDDLFSNVRMSDNASNNLGGAVFRSAYWGAGYGKQTITWENSRFERNRSATGGGGAAYVNNSLFVLRGGVTFDANDAGSGDSGGLKMTGVTVNASDVTVTNNKSVWAGGIGHWSGGPEGAGWSVRVNATGNAPNDIIGVFPR